jgi:hypothetical protein
MLSGDSATLELAFEKGLRSDRDRGQGAIAVEKRAEARTRRRGEGKDGRIVPFAAPSPVARRDVVANKLQAEQTGRGRHGRGDEGNEQNCGDAAEQGHETFLKSWQW